MPKKTKAKKTKAKKTKAKKTMAKKIKAKKTMAKKTKAKKTKAKKTKAKKTKAKKIKAKKIAKKKTGTSGPSQALRCGAQYQRSVETIRNNLAAAEKVRGQRSFPLPEPRRVYLSLRDMKGVTTLEALAEFPELDTLAFWCPTVKDLTGVQYLPRLRHVTFDRKTKVKGGLLPLSSVPLESLRVGPSLLDQLSDLDLSRLEELHLWDASLATLDSLPVLPSLKELHVGWRSSALTSFESFNSVPNVEVVSISDAKRLKDCEGLEQCSSLRVLKANHSSVESLEGLHANRALEVLEVRGAPLSSVSPLFGKGSLKTLRVERTKLKSVDGIAHGLPGLERLDLWGTKVRDLTPLVGLERLDYLALSGLKPRDWSPLSSLTGLELLDLCGSSFSDLAPIVDLPNLRRVRLTATVLDPGATAVKALAEVLETRGGGVSFRVTGNWPYDEEHQGKLGLIQ